eukprot:Gb_19152 [translate_table: standard]
MDNNSYTSIAISCICCRSDESEAETGLPPTESATWHPELWYARSRLLTRPDSLEASRCGLADGARSEQ